MINVSNGIHELNGLPTGPVRGGFQSVHRSGPGEPRRSVCISEGCYSLSHRRFILIFPHFFKVFSTIVSLLRLQILVIDHHSHLHCNQERPSLHFITYIYCLSGQILNLEKGLSLPQGPLSGLVPPCKISLGGPAFLLVIMW